ncbi:MAG: hypothetical protein EAZ95_14275 [Bacteroidetes bacterium]|nr:MAG: hypothetical protein EAZ95_14275 [Bacteroidota bacterium]
MENKLPQELEFYQSYILFHWIALLLFGAMAVIGAVMFFTRLLPLHKIIQICGMAFIIFSLIPLLSDEVRFTTPEKNASFHMNQEGIICLDKKRTNMPEMGRIAWKSIVNEKLQAERPYRSSLRLKFQVRTEQEKPIDINFDVFLMAKHEGKTIDKWANEYLQASRKP